MIKKFIPFYLLILSFSYSAFAQNIRTFPEVTLPEIRLPVERNELTTVEKCRRHFTKTRCIQGEIQKFPFLEITYVTTDKCGKSVEWTKVYSTGDAVNRAGVPIEGGGGLKGVLNGFFSASTVRKIIGTE